MADFGVIFDEIKDELIEARRSAAENEARSQREADERFAESIKPITLILDPVLKQAQESLFDKGVKIEIDHVPQLRMDGVVKAQRKVFQLISEFKARSRIVVVTLSGPHLSWAYADSDNPNPMMLRGGESMTYASFTTKMAEDLIVDAIKEIMPNLV